MAYQESVYLDEEEIKRYEYETFHDIANRYYGRNVKVKGVVLILESE